MDGKVFQAKFNPLVRRWTLDGLVISTDGSTARNNSPRSMSPKSDSPKFGTAKYNKSMKFMPSVFDENINRTIFKDGNSPKTFNDQQLSFDFKDNPRKNADLPIETSPDIINNVESETVAFVKSPTRLNTIMKRSVQVPPVAKPTSKDARSSSSSKEIKASMEDELKDEVIKKIRFASQPSILTDLSDAELDHLVRLHLGDFPMRYVMSVDSDSVVLHMRLLLDAKEQAHTVYCGALPDASKCLITIACVDRPKVYNRITVALDRVTAYISDADIMTSKSGMVLDRFIVRLKSRFKGNFTSVEDEIVRYLRFDSRTLSDPSFRQISIGSESSGSRESSEQDYWEYSPRQPIARSSSSSCLPDETAPPINSLGLTGSVTKAESTDQKQDVSTANTPAHAFDAVGLLVPSGMQFMDMSMDEFDTDRLEEIGKGLFSVTHKTVMKRDKTAVVIKRPLTSSGASSSSQTKHDAETLMMREIKTVRGLQDHVNVCRVIGACLRPHNVFICYAFIDGITLARLIYDKSRTYDYLTIALHIARGMNSLHEQSILHRDLKSANVIMDSEGVCKIVDMGLSCSLGNSRDLTAETGTYRWMAPEVIRHEKYSTPADVYSYAILLWELLAREQPYFGMTPIQAAFGVAKDHLRPTIPPTVSSRAKAMLQRCWHPSPDMRPKFSEIIELIPQLR